MPSESVYRGYGLTIRSAVPLPEMFVGSGIADVHIVLGAIPEPTGWLQVSPRLFGTTGSLRFGLSNRATMLASDGRRVVVQLGPGIEPHVVRPYLLSSAMAAVLHQRSYLPLHASVMETENGCIAFMGRRGAGKSTLAAFMTSAGGVALSDDICAVTFVDEQPIVWPNRQRFKLVDDAAKFLHFNCDSAERLPGGKLSLAVRTVSDDAPRRLRAIFVLTPATACTVRRLDSGEALAALVEHTLRPLYVVGLGIQREHLQRCATVAATTAVFALSTVRDLTRLGAVASLVALSSRASDERIDVPSSRDTAAASGRRQERR